MDIRERFTGLDSQPPKKPEKSVKQEGQESDEIDVDNLPGRIREDQGTGTFRKAQALEKSLPKDDSEK